MAKIEQPHVSAQKMAREVLWTYAAATEESGDKQFYTDLMEPVLAAIRCACAENTRIWVGREISLKVGPYTLQAHLANIEPVLATSVDVQRTTFLAQHRARAKDEGQELARFISEVIRYPDEQMEAVYESLIGLDAIKHDIVRKLYLLLQPRNLEKWLEQHHPRHAPQTLEHILRDRYPLFLLEGEVGSGKTALARSVGSRVARAMGSELMLLVVSTQIRGGGHVGELTQSLSRAFDEAERRQEREQIPVIVLVDEADSLAQARGSTQTHHEDDAGVNTLIQRIDRLRRKPLAVFFATNLAQSLDAAILRRACATYHFDRPGAEQRVLLFQRILTDMHVDEAAIAQLVALTEPRPLPGFGLQLHRYTYSDLVQRLLPGAVEEAIYKNQALSIDALLNACHITLPTPEARYAPLSGERFQAAPRRKPALQRQRFYHARQKQRGGTSL